MSAPPADAGALDPEVQAILDRRYPSCREPLARAWAWNREDGPASWRKAEALTRALLKDFEDVLQVRYELAFSLVKQGRRPDALAVLRQTEREFSTLDEDTLSLIGRCCKDAGHELDEADLPAQAEHSYQEAERAYEKAYGLRFDRYPRINQAALLVFRAGLLAQLARKEDQARQERLRREALDLLARGRGYARELLDQSSSWVVRLPDDLIWNLATAAEAHLLRGEWHEAASAYQLALAEANRPLPHHFTSMRTQVERLCRAFERLGIKPEGPLACPETIFTVPKKVEPLNV